MATWGATRGQAARAGLAILLAALLSFATKRPNQRHEVEAERVTTLPAGRTARAVSGHTSAPARPAPTLAFADLRLGHAAGENSAMASDPTQLRRGANPLPAYLDQLIDPNIGDEPGIGMTTAASTGGLPGGTTIEYRGFYDDMRGTMVGSYKEQGVGIDVRRDSDSFGRFELRSAFTDARGDGFSTGNFDGGRSVNLAQRDFALTDTWLMNNQVGHIRARIPEMFWQDSYIRLPEPLVEGASSDLSSPGASFRIASGTLGIYQGRTFPVFTTDFSSGRATGASGTFRLNPYWDASAVAWQSSQVTTTYDGIQDFTSLAGGLRYANRDRGNKAQINWLSNNNGRAGMWFDGETRVAGWIHDAGVYRMDPKLQWIDANSPILMDTQGLYWRGATRSFDHSAGLGADWSQTNVNNDALVPRRTNANAFGTLGSRVTPAFDVTAYMGIGQENVTGAGTDTKAHTIAGRGSASSRHDSGVSTLTLGRADRYGNNEYSRLDASWDYLWNPFASFSGLRAGIAYARQTGSTNDFSQTSARVGATWSYNSLSLSGNASYGNVSGGSVDSNVTSTAGMAMAWQFAPNWQLSSDITYNQNALVLVGPPNHPIETRIGDTLVFVRLRYDASWGRPEPLVGASNSKLGHGAVRGILFMDKNGNGLRDADEPGVPHVTIYLDGGSSIETNANGEFAFNRVASGDHHLQIDVANVPLPWSVNEEKPLVVTVEPRETERVDIPLVQPGSQIANSRS
jgi:hypothetical protein